MQFEQRIFKFDSILCTGRELSIIAEGYTPLFLNKKTTARIRSITQHIVIKKGRRAAFSSKEGSIIRHSSVATGASDQRKVKTFALKANNTFPCVSSQHQESKIDSFAHVYLQTRPQQKYASQSLSNQI